MTNGSRFSDIWLPSSPWTRGPGSLCLETSDNHAAIDRYTQPGVNDSADA